jgi:hydrogenase maturation factor
LPGTTSGDLAVASLAMARRLEAGATIWCLSPASPRHADDVVADLTHPTAEGRRALRAVAVHDRDPVGRLREQADSGDLLLAISAANQVEVAATMHRAPAWGLATIWIGSGPRPEPGAADNVLWVDSGSDSDFEAHADDLAALRHRLLELTRGLLEDPSLVGMGDPGACSVNGVCVTCADEGHLGEVVTVRVEGDFDRLAVARTAGGLEEVDASLVGDLAPGDLVVIHAGSAIGLVEKSSGSASGTAHDIAGGATSKTASGSAR